eukprot:UN22573
MVPNTMDCPQQNEVVNETYYLFKRFFPQFIRLTNFLYQGNFVRM